VRTFQLLAALLALIMLVRHGRAALAIFDPRGGASGPGRLASLMPLLTCLVAAAVLAMSVKGLMAGPPPPGATP
jgi:hypothetical protein